MAEPKKIIGVGINNSPVPATYTTNGERVKERWYSTWRNMVRRCYDEKRLVKFPTYRGCTVSKEWLYAETFRLWFVENYREGWHLDKDLLTPENKVYSAETCCFVPPDVNMFLTGHNAARGQYPQGVVWHKRKGKYQAGVRFSGKLQHLGLFACPLEAFNTYIESKRGLVPQLLARYPDMDPRIDEALLNRHIDLIVIDGRDMLRGAAA